MLFFVFYGLLLLNVLTFVLFWIDKCKAKRGKWRIAERLLLLLAFIGGSIGALMAMSLFRHKTEKKIFSIGIPILLVIQLLLLTYIIMDWLLYQV